MTRSHAAPPSDMFTFRFEQIKQKLGSPRFYYTFESKKFEDLTPEQQAIYDEEDYNRLVMLNTISVNTAIGIYENLADKYDLTPIK